MCYNKRNILSWLTRLTALSILLITANCSGCDRINPASNSNPGESENNGPGENGTIRPNLELIGPDNLVDTDTFKLEMDNKGSEEADLGGVTIIIGIQEAKDFDGKEVDAGTISYVGQGLSISSGGHIKNSAAALTKKQKLAMGQRAEIPFRIKDISNMASATIVCQLQDAEGGEIARKEIPWKLTNKLGPNEESTVELSIDPTIVFDYQTGKLTFKTKVKNTSDHPIALSSLTHQYKAPHLFDESVDFTGEEWLHGRGSIL